MPSSQAPSRSPLNEALQRGLRLCRRLLHLLHLLPELLLLLVERLWHLRLRRFEPVETGRQRALRLIIRA